MEKNPIENMWIESLQKQMEQYLYWQMEAIESMLKGDFYSILPQTFMTEKMFEMYKYYKMLGDKVEGIDWNKMYMEASEKARKRYMEENKGK